MRSAISPGAKKFMTGPTDSAEQERHRDEYDSELAARRDTHRNGSGGRIHGGANGVGNLGGGRVGPVDNDDAVPAWSLHHMGEAAGMPPVRLLQRFVFPMAEESMKILIRQQFGVNGCPAHHNLEIALDESRGAPDRDGNPPVILQRHNLASVIRAAQIDGRSGERQCESEPACNQAAVNKQPWERAVQTSSLLFSAYGVCRYFSISSCAFCVLSRVRWASVYSLTARSRCPVISKILPM